MASLNKSRIRIVLISSFIIFAVVGSCATGNFGRLQSDRETTVVFEALKVLPNHKYYFRGTFSRPHVIAGIHEDFTLNLKLWVKIDTRSDDFKTLVQRVSLQGMGSTVQPWGFKILDPNGQYVGIWYSALGTASVQINEKNEIITLAPTGGITRGGQR
jgi:hypothetical protein